jgi:hypothetical protein
MASRVPAVHSVLPAVSPAVWPRGPTASTRAVSSLSPWRHPGRTASYGLASSGSTPNWSGSRYDELTALLTSHRAGPYRARRLSAPTPPVRRSRPGPRREPGRMRPRGPRHHLAGLTGEEPPMPIGPVLSTDRTGGPGKGAHWGPSVPDRLAGVTIHPLNCENFEDGSCAPCRRGVPWIRQTPVPDGAWLGGSRRLARSSGYRPGGGGGHGVAGSYGGVPTNVATPRTMYRRRSSTSMATALRTVILAISYSCDSVVSEGIGSPGWYVPSSIRARNNCASCTYLGTSGRLRLVMINNASCLLIIY